MSEMGPISRSPCFFCRMISCPAANGIICSICRPSATLAPSGTCSVIACRIVIVFDTAISGPLHSFSLQHQKVLHEHPPNLGAYLGYGPHFWQFRRSLLTLPSPASTPKNIDLHDST